MDLPQNIHRRLRPTETVVHALHSLTVRAREANPDGFVAVIPSNDARLSI
jgi:hypothetical protein